MWFRRLKTARKCALQVSSPSFRTRSEAEQEAAVSNMAEPAVEVHNRFMTLASDLIDGAHDSSTYEDACRLLLGMLLPIAPSFHPCALFGMWEYHF